jgi:hypothetical protein
MAVAYRIAPGGGISEYDIPPAGMLIGGGFRLLDGREDEHWQPWTLDQVAGITTRCAPWTTTWCAPVIEDAEGESWDGWCFAGCRTLAVATRWSAHYSLATAFHEAGHACDGHLLPHVREVLDSATADTDWPGDYLASGSERRARYLEHAAMALLHGAVLHMLPGSAVEIAHQFFTGELGREIVAAQAASRRATPLSSFGPLSLRAA